MKVFRLLCGFCFFLFLFHSVQAQKLGGGGLGGGGDLPCLKCPPPIDLDPSASEGCPLDWKLQGLSQTQVGLSSFTGTGSALADLSLFQGGNVNGWVNYVVNAGSTATYEMLLQLGNTPYKIVYKASQTSIVYFGGMPYEINLPGLLEVHVSGSAVYSSQVLRSESRSVFRIAKEGNVMRFYKNNALIPLPTTVMADTGGGATVAVSTDSEGRIRVTVFSPTCQELIPSFDIASLDCAGSTGSLDISSVQGGTGPYTYYFDDSNLSNSTSIATPTTGWITTVDQYYRASTYYMGIGNVINWQHTGTQLIGNILTSTTSASNSIPTNTLLSQENGWLGFRKETATGWTVGFITASNSGSMYEFRANSAIKSDIYIGGTYIRSVQALLTDYLRISKEGSSIKFYVNEVEVYSQSISSSVNLKSKFAFTELGSSISYPTLSFCTPLSSAVITLANTNLSACQNENIPVITPTTQNVTELRWYTTNPDGVSPRPNSVSGFSFDPDATGYLTAGTHYYYVTGVDLNGQETSSQQITLIVYALPSVSIDPPSTFCPGSSITLTASAQASTSSYKWFKDGVLLAGQSTRNLTLSQNGIYKVQVTTAQGCIATSEKNVQQLNFSLNLSYATSSSGCGQIYLKTTSNINNIYYTYQKKTATGGWVNQNTYILNIYSPTPNDLIPINQSGVYRIASTYETCTVYSNELSVTIHPSTYSVISPTPSVCQGSSVTLSISNYNPSYSYQWKQQVGGNWTNVGTTQSITVAYVTGATSANFQVITTDPVTGCSTTTPHSITYILAPSITYTSFVEAQVGDVVGFDVVSGGNYTYQWTGPNGYTFSSANPSISVASTSYGEYVVVVSAGTCQTTYRAILAEKNVFATLKENLDASYYHTNREGKLYFKFDEKYGLGVSGTASVSTYNYDYQEVDQRELSKEYGYNWYSLDLSSFGIEGDQYVLHIRDELDRRYVLRVKYATGNNKVTIGNDFTTCISQSNDLRSVRLDAMSYVDIAPYSISWYVSTDYTKINQLETLSNTDREALLFAQEQNITQQYSTALFSTQQSYLNQSMIYAPSEGTYYVRAKIKNYCTEEEIYSDQVVIITLNLDPSCRVAANELPSKEKHRFQVLFSIKRLFSPKATSDPSTR